MGEPFPDTTKQLVERWSCIHGMPSWFPLRFKQEADHLIHMAQRQEKWRCAELICQYCRLKLPFAFCEGQLVGHTERCGPGPNDFRAFPCLAVEMHQESMTRDRLDYLTGNVSVTPEVVDRIEHPRFYDPNL